MFFVQDYDIPITANFIEEMHEAVKNARDLVVLFTRDYEQSPPGSGGSGRLGCVWETVDV
jgi:hypothetical protein